MIPAWFCQSPRIQTPPLSHLWDHRFEFINMTHDIMIICYLSSSLMGPISGGSTKKRVRKYGAMARVSITFIVAWQAESWWQCLDQLPSHLHEGPFLRRSSQTETILDGEVGNADLSLVKLVSLISLLIGQYISPPQWRPGWDCPPGRPWHREPGEQRISFHFWQSHLFWAPASSGKCWDTCPL